MSVNPEKIKSRRISSILKRANNVAEGDNTTETFNRVPKRISFSATKNVKEFKVDETNATIWGQSLEVNAISSDQENVSQPPTDVISLFADTEHDDEAMDVETVDSNQQRQSVIQRSPLKDVNQTMFMNQTCDITNMNKTMFGSAIKLENTSLVGTNKRKSVPNISVDNSVSLSPIEKLRKINEIELGLTLAPDNIFTETVVMEIDDNRTPNLDETRIWDADLSTDEYSNDVMNVTNHRINLFLDESLSSNPLNETSTTVTNMVYDDHSMTSLLPHTRKPKRANETRIFGQEDVNAVIDQTVLTGNLLEDQNFSKYSILKCQSSSTLGNDDEYIENNASKAKDVQNSDAACPSMLTNTDNRVIDQNSEYVQSPIIRNIKSESILTDDFMSLEPRDHCRELYILNEEPLTSPTLLKIKSESILTNDDIVNRRREKSGLTFMHKDVVSEVKHHVQDCLDVSEKEGREEEQRSPNYHSKSRSTLEKERSPTFYHVKQFACVPKRHVPDLLEVLDKRHRDEGQRSSTFNHAKSGSTTQHAEFVSTLEVQRSPSFYHTNATSMNNNMFVSESKHNVPDSVEEKRHSDDHVEFTKVRQVSKSLLPSLNFAGQNLDGKTSHEMSLCSMTSEKDNEFKNEANISSVPLYQLPNVPEVIDNRQKFSSTKFFNNSINASQAGNQFLAICDLTFANCDPLSSTKIFAKKSLTPNITNEIKPIQTSLSFNSSSPILRKSRLCASSHNNTDELCNLEPEQLRKVDAKKMFLDITNDMLSETKHELVDSKMEESTSDIRIEKTESQLNMQNNIRCQKCSNCRKSIDGNVTFLKIQDLKELQLDFSGYEEFKGLATYRDVIEARKKRKEAKELAKQSLMDQNVPHPGWEILWENKKAEIMLLPQPEYEPMLLTIFPMRMSIEFLLKNKMGTEYTKWKYFDNYFFIGGIALRHEKIPSIRIHIKFDRNGPDRAQKLSIPLAFKRVFVEECPYYLKNISARNYLKHKHGLAMLPLNLTTMCSDSENIYKALDQFDEWFESVVVKVNELIQLTIESGAFLKMSERQCYIEKTVFDIKNYLTQKFVIKLDKIDKVGWRNVSFQPGCETTDEFKNLPLGLPFLRTFLENPKSFLLQFIDGGIS